MNTSDLVAVTSRSFSKNEKLIEVLQSKYKKIKLNEEGLSLSGESLISFCNDADKVIVGLEIFNSKILEKLPNLKVLSKYGVGLNNIDLQELKKRNIKLGFTAGINKRPVAELTMSLIFTSLRRTHNSLEKIKRGTWSQERGNELYRKSIGILGFGNIGSLLYDLIKPFECEVLVYEINEIDKQGINQTHLDEIAEKVDILSIHLPLTKETNHLIGKKFFGLCKKDLKIINTSRGGIINEKYLERFLSENENAFAALDVFEEEPAFNSPLLNLRNFFATSHLGSMTEEGVISMGLAAINGLEQNR